MRNAGWAPKRTYTLASVLERKVVGALRVGSPVELIEEELGPPEHPAAKQSRKSKIWAWTYGNLTVLVTGRLVIALVMDFEGGGQQVIDAHDHDSWRVREWESFGQGRGWSKRIVSGVINLHGDGVNVGLGPDGKLHVVSISEPAK